MSAYYNLFDGLRALKQGDKNQMSVESGEVDTILEQLTEWANASQNTGLVEVSGESATNSLSVVLAGIKSVKEKRQIEVAEIMKSS